MNGTKNHSLAAAGDSCMSPGLHGQSRRGMLQVGPLAALRRAWQRIKTGIEETNWDEKIIQADDRIRAFIYGLLAFAAIYFGYGVAMGLITRG